MNDAASVIRACRQLLSRATWTETEARDAVTLCDAWLNENRKQLLPVSRKPSRFPTELVELTLRNFRESDKIPKRTLLTCRLVNKEWARIAWEVYSASSAVCRVSDPGVLEIMKGVQVRWLYLEDDISDIGVLLGSPTMCGIRVLDCSGCASFTPSQLLTVFQNVRQLVGLVIAIYIESDEWDDMGEHHGSQMAGTGRWENKEDVIWKTGFGNLRALNISVEGPPVGGFVFSDVIAANVQTQLEYFSFGNRGDATLMDSFFPKMADKGPELKYVQFSSDNLLPSPRFIETLSHWST